MKISKETLTLLKNFAGINPSIHIKPGNVISTLSVDKNIIAYTEIDETFDKDFVIYDLNEFLSVLDLFDDPELVLSDKSVNITAGKSKCNYVYCDPSVIVSPSKRIVFPTSDVQFNLTKDELDKLLRAANTLGLNYLNVTKNQDNEIVISVVDPKNSSSNTFSCIVGEDKTTHSYSFFINTEFLKFIKDDYQVAISRKLICKFESANVKGLEYFIALDKSSTFTE